MRACCWLWVILLAGCGVSIGSGHADDEPEAAHEDPAYKPLHLLAALEALPRRMNEIHKELTQVPPANTETARAEFLAIVNWLPELAGDSDLSRADWETVVRATQTLQQLCQGWGAPAAAGYRPLDGAQVLAVIDQLLPLGRQVYQTLPYSMRPEPAIATEPDPSEPMPTLEQN